MTTPRQLAALYGQGRNIAAHLREELGLQHNSREIIEITYDLQTGSYISALQDLHYARCQDEYSRGLAEVVRSLGKPESLLEAGIGEATTLSGVLSHLGPDIRSYGFDLSWSRVSYARRWLHSKGLPNTVLCCADLLNIPFLDNSIDIVYTSHAIEPNGGFEEPILRELYRVAGRYLILLEPGYELANEESRQRMDSHGYCKNLRDTALSLGYDVQEHRLFPVTPNPLNPTALTVIRKGSSADLVQRPFACPKLKTPLVEVGGMWYSPEALVVYPTIGGIPCLRIENGILASKYQEIF